MSLGCRVGEDERNWFRSERIYNLDGRWFFTTREGDELGPFPNHEVAKEEAKGFADVVCKDGILAAEHFVHSRSRVNL
jgi:hypothetical protein